MVHDPHDLAWRFPRSSVNVLSLSETTDVTQAMMSPSPVESVRDALKTFEAKRNAEIFSNELPKKSIKF
jgi:hypothetical protein